MKVLKVFSVKKTEIHLFYLLLFFLPTQLGKHFWPDFAFIMGVRVDYLSPTIYFTDILAGLLWVFWLYNNGKQLIFHKISRRVTLFALFVLLLTLQIYLSGNSLNGWYHLLKLLEFSFITYYIATTRGISLAKISISLAGGVIVESVLAITQYLNHGSIGGIFYFLGERNFTAATPGIANASIAGELILRPYGTFPHPNVLAGYLLVSMLCIFFFLFQNKNKGLAAFALFLGSSALLLTLSRIAIILWIVFIISILIVLVKRSFEQKKKQAITIFSISMILITCGWIIFSHTLIPRFSETTFSEEAVVHRSELTKAAVEMIGSNPLFGIGLGNFLPVLSTRRSPLSLGLYLQPVHNIFLLAAAETGLVGLVIFCWYIAVLFKRLISRITTNILVRESFGLIVILVSILILGMFDHYFLTLQQGQLLFAVILGLCFTAVKEPLNLRKAKISRTW